MKRKKTIVLGPEYDESLRTRLRGVLASLGAQSGNRAWALGGSQEIESLSVEIGGSSNVIEVETYVGLSISGEASLIDRVAALGGVSTD